MFFRRHFHGLAARARFTRLLGEMLEPRLPLAITAELLADINRLPAGVSVNSDLVPVGNVAFFATEQGLWKTDGTAAGTLLLSPIRPLNLPFVNVGGTLFFTANDGVHGIELWKSDGTSAGTVMVKDITPGVNTGNAFGPRGLANVNGTLFFSANDGTHGYEFWKSDGTAAGTVLVKDIRPGAPDSAAGGFTNVNGVALFSASDGQLGMELWKTDGTDTGTALVKNIRPGFESSQPRNLINAGGTLFFVADDGLHGYELWRSDGTSGGTVLLKDILPGIDSSLSSRPGVFANVGGTLFFAADDGVSGQELWKSDGTPNGTVQVKDINPGASGSFPDGLTDVNGVLFFRASSNLWKSDGTSAGTVLVKQIDVGNTFSLFPSLANVNGNLFFPGNDGTTGYELWKSDGMTAGTALVEDIFSGTNHSYPRRLTNLNGTLLFIANQALNEGRLWRSDGTATGTTPVPSGNATLSSDNADDVSDPLQWNETVGSFNYFVADDGLHGYELWRTDGTTAGTILVSDVRPGIAGSHPRYLTNVNGSLFFMAGAASGMSLYKHDPSAGSTVELANFQSGGSLRENLVNVGGTLFFRADDRTHGVELWKSDGTTTGTVLVKDILPGQNGYRYSQYPYDLTNVSGRLFFRANDGTNGAELWTSDGTGAGTVLVKDINPGAPSGVGAYLTNVNGTLLFLAADAGGPALGRSDGTEAGTTILKSFVEATRLTNVAGTLYFAAVEGATGRELWRSDGTAAGTVLVKDIMPGFLGSSPAHLTNVNGTLFFATTFQYALWKSDGTEAGTVLLREFPGQGSRELRELTNVNGQLFFSTFEFGLGQELWASDGTTAGTMLVKDILPGAYSSAPRNLRAFQGRLLFSADDGIHGRELWVALSVEEPPPPPPEPPQFDLSLPNRAAIVADPNNPGQLALLIVGGAASDVIVVEPRPSNPRQIRVKQNGRLLGLFPTAEFERIAAFGMAGNDTILIDPRIGKPAELHGRAGNDSVFGGSGNDLVFGEAGKDRLFGRSGSDQLEGGEGNDSLFGAAGNDTLRGDAGNDLLFGDAGHDFLLGGSGNDQLFGALGRDALIGGAGRDLLFGQHDDDILIGGSTAYDDDALMQAQIVAAWTTAASFNTRVSTLAALLDSSSVLGDSTRDQLSGGSASDWFLNIERADLLLDFSASKDRGR